MDFRVIISGCRHWHCRDFADRVLASLVACRDNGFSVAENFRDAPKVFTHLSGRQQVVADAGADLCLAFHPDLAKSKGTGDMVMRALKAGIPTWWTASETTLPIRQLLPGALP